MLNKVYNNILTPKCDYNPFIAIWKRQKDYVTIEECVIECYKLGIIIDYNKIEAINKMNEN